MKQAESADEQEQPRLAFSCYVFTSGGRFLLTMRGPRKRTWPGVWTNSCSGRPAPEESLADAVARTLGGELGLSAAGAEPVLPAFRYRGPGGAMTVVSEAGDLGRARAAQPGLGGVRLGEPAGDLCPVYRVVTDQIPRPDPGEVGDFEWVGWGDFVYAVTTGEISVPPWCRAQVAELSMLGVDPIRWPAVDVAVLPAA